MRSQGPESDRFPCGEPWDPSLRAQAIHGRHREPFTQKSQQGHTMRSRCLQRDSMDDCATHEVKYRAVYVVHYSQRPFAPYYTKIRRITLRNNSFHSPRFSFCHFFAIVSFSSENGPLSALYFCLCGKKGLRTHFIPKVVAILNAAVACARLRRLAARPDIVFSKVR